MCYVYDAYSNTCRCNEQKVFGNLEKQFFLKNEVEIKFVKVCKQTSNYVVV